VKDMDLDEFEMTLSYIKSTSAKIRMLEICRESQDQIESVVNNGGEIVCEENGRVDRELTKLKYYLSELKERKVKLMSSRDFSQIESKFHDAVKVEAEIKRAAKEAYREMSRTWTALSHPAMDPLSWIREWIRREAKLVGVSADENTEVSIEYSVHEVDRPRNYNGLALAKPKIISRKFSLMDIVTNRYNYDPGVRAANSGSMKIHWDNSYPKKFVERLTSGKVSDEHEAALTRHLAMPGTGDRIANYFRQEVIAIAQTYLTTPERGREYEAIIRNFIAGRVSAKPVYAAGEILDRMFLIPGPNSGKDGVWGVLCSIVDEKKRFVELPRSRALRVTVVESNDAWLRRHLPLSKRGNTKIVRPHIADPITPLSWEERRPFIDIFTERSSIWSAETKSIERIIADNYAETIRSNMDFMTTTDAELWTDWISEKASLAGLVISLALIPAAIVGVPHMLVAGLLTTVVTAVLPNVAKIYVNKGDEKREEGVKEILRAFALEAIGYGISKAVIRIGALVSKNGTTQLVSQVVDTASENMRGAIERAIGPKTLSIVPKSVGENLDEVLNFIDDLDIALELTRNTTETMAPWRHFGLELSNVELDSFLLKWGVQKARKAGEISNNVDLTIRVFDPTVSAGAKISVDNYIGRDEST